ncbi:hypothetical protein L6259_01795 [Candidatus Parcubacteria bacterium]|nr:hypothetical protein [Patescibacteria group bacterium]MCG2693988.1 hypothetical protein [Candidatus Parcubacteria bacterium]
MADIKNLIQKITEDSVNFLSKKQEPDGDFLSLSTPSLRDFDEPKIYHSPFPASLILACLNALSETPELKELKRKTAQFLLSQKSEHWSWNYWTRDSEQFKEKPYPEDMDDTFCALSALAGYNPKLFDGKTLAQIIMLLTATEVKEGGPYRTWLVSPDAPEIWRDVDLAVNSNIAYFLSLQDVFLNNLVSLIEQTIEKEKYISPYYPSEYPIIYFISRFYRGSKQKQITDYLLSRQDADNKWENPLYTALAVSALLNFGCNKNILEKSILYLTGEYQNGAWPAYAFCIDPSLGGNKYYAGSPALTTAFCLEALSKYSEEDGKKNIPQNARNISDKKAKKDYLTIASKAKERFSDFEDNFKKLALNTLSRIIKKDKDKQVVLLPYFFKLALGKEGEKIDLSLLIQLGLANLWGWIAYTIYDDFLDEEGDPRLLSLANVALRELSIIFKSTLPKNKEFQSFWQNTLDKIDAANVWETTNCRLKIDKSNLIIPSPLPDFGDYSKLAERSIGHFLGPAAILFSLGYKKDSPEIKNLSTFFHHYIIARQLNDDAHDWEDDLKKGQLTGAVSLTIKKWQDKHPTKKRINIKNDLSELQQIFWNETIAETCYEIKKQVALARECLEKNAIIQKPAKFFEILRVIESSADQALKEQKETVEFLKTYKAG